MSVTLENYTNIVGGSTLNKHFLFTSEGGFIGVTTALASTADQITAGNAFGSSAGEFTVIYNNYETTAGFTTASGGTATPFDSSVSFLQYLDKPAIVVSDGPKQAKGTLSAASLSTSRFARKNLAGATYNLPMDPRAEIVLSMTGPAGNITAGFTFGERVFTFADNITGASGANATGPTGITVEGFVSRWDPSSLELYLFGVGSTQDLGDNAGISGPTAQFDAGYSAAAGGGTVWHSPTAGNIAVGATIQGEISGSTGFQITAKKTLISTEQFKSSYLGIVGGSFDAYYGATFGLTFGFTGGTYSAASDTVATGINSDLRSILTDMREQVIIINASHAVAGDNPSHPAYIREAFVRGLSGNAAGPAGASGGFTLSTIRAGTAGGNATAGVTGTASQFDQVLVEINNLVTLQEAKKDTKFREYDTADSIRKTLMIDF